MQINEISYQQQEIDMNLNLIENSKIKKIRTNEDVINSNIILDNEKQLINLSQENLNKEMDIESPKIPMNLESSEKNENLINYFNQDDEFANNNYTMNQDEPRIGLIQALNDLNEILEIKLNR